MVNNWEDFVNQTPSQQPEIIEDLKRGIPNRPPMPPMPPIPDDDRAALYISREALEKANMAMADANVGMNKVREILTVVEDFLVKYEDLKLKLIDAKISIDVLEEKMRNQNTFNSQIAILEGDVRDLRDEINNLKSSLNQ